MTIEFSKEESDPERGDREGASRDWRGGVQREKKTHGWEKKEKKNQ